MTEDIIETVIERLDVDAAAPADPFPDEASRPCWCCYDGWIERHGKKYRPGVYWHGMTKPRGKGEPVPVDTWVCAPLHVEAITANREDGEHGRLLHYLSSTGRWKKWAMPMQMLAGDGVEVRGVLMAQGLEIDLQQKARVLEFINSEHPKKRLRAATNTGWHDSAFVLPDEVIGASDVWFQATDRTAPYGTAGTLDGWQREVAAYAPGNDVLTLALSAAFAGVLLEGLNVGGAGLHLYGPSSKGKTSAVCAATSVWGGAAFMRAWRATSNGLEGAAKMHSGTLLVLDEVSEVQPRDLYEAAYELINGHGKGRATQRGEARQVSRWRVFVLSTGEVTITSRMAAGGLRANVGQTLRLLDTPAVTGTYGAWNKLHGLATGRALSDAIRNGAARHYGHAGPAFVRALIGMGSDLDLPGRLEAVLARFDAAGQEVRAARVFALCALAAEMAAGARIVPWSPGEAADAAVRSFNLWRSQRETGGQDAEDAAILQRVADFIDRYGDARFSDISGSNEAYTVHDRAGYVDSAGPTTAYLFTAVGLREATQGCDFARVVRVLDAAGAFVKKGSSKTALSTRTPDGRTPRLYHIDPARLTVEDEK